MKQRKLELAADEWGVQPPCDACRCRVHVLEAERRDWFALPLHAEAMPRAEFRGVLDQRVGRSPDQDLSRPGGLLQPLGEVHGVAGDERRTRPGVAGHDLTRVDSDPALELDAPGRLQLDVQFHQLAPHRLSGPHCPERVVLVHRGNAEDGHHLVATESLNDAAVALHDRLHLIEVP